MGKISYWIKQLLPLDYFTKYRSGGNLYVATWRQRFGQPYNIHHYQVVA